MFLIVYRFWSYDISDFVFFFLFLLCLILNLSFPGKKNVLLGESFLWRLVGVKLGRSLLYFCGYVSYILS